MLANSYLASGTNDCKNCIRKNVSIFAFETLPHMANDSERLKTRQLINFLVEDRYRLLRHASLLLGLLALLYTAEFSKGYSGYSRYYSLFAVYFVFISMFYINTYILVSYLFFKGRYLLYLILLVVVVMVGLSSVSYILNTHLGAYRVLEENQGYPQDFYKGTVVSICVILVTTTLKLLQRWAKDNERLVELTNLTLRMELNELRNQISPHFLFNMLNNVKALIRTNPEMATTVIIKLSEFLRFQLYENSEEKTLLVSEINFLSNYVNLEKIRRDNLSITIEDRLDEQTLRKVSVPPNLFIMFIENAVKHSVDLTDKGSYINIRFETINDKLLRFSCVNSVSPAYVISDKKSSGLGLANIKRRLELLYQDTYRLDITATDNVYKVDLTIPI